MKKINQVVRQNIFDIFKISNTVWYGNLNDIGFLSRLFDLSKLPSYDERHKDASGDIYQHRINNPGDWDDDWIFTDKRFDLLNCDNDILLKFLCLSLHPTVIDDLDKALYLKEEFNKLLKDLGYEIYEKSTLAGRPLFDYRNINYHPKIKIYTDKYKKYPPMFSEETFCPCLYLIMDNWDDFTWKTTFNAFYFKKDKKIIELGPVKILQKNKQITLISNNIERLPNDYVSLGGTMEYYDKIKNLPIEEYELILDVLNDAVFKGEKFYKEFLLDPGWKISLMRFSESEKALNEAGKLFQKDYKDFEQRTKFSFVTRIEGFNREHKINFDFSKNKIPYRINVLIGKNGTGKTSILAKLANALSGLLNDKENFGYFEPKPYFSKIIAISYSVFDKFEIPNKKDAVFSYLFLGMRTSEKKSNESKLERIINRDELKEKFSNAVLIIEQSQRVKIWSEVMGKLLEIENFNSENCYEIFEKASSGEAIMLNIFTNIVAYIREQSLLLVDEPEVHLHPNAISNFTRMLNAILIHFDSYAIISTHSPIVIQEIPSKYIHVLKKEGSEPIVNKLSVESFGENLSMITNEIFETDYSISSYKNIFKKLLEKYSYQQILDLFDSELSFNAKLYLQALADSKNEKLKDTNN